MNSSVCIGAIRGATAFRGCGSAQPRAGILQIALYFAAKVRVR
jgi:hypothetical protein